MTKRQDLIDEAEAEFVSAVSSLFSSFSPVFKRRGPETRSSLTESGMRSRLYEVFIDCEQHALCGMRSDFCTQFFRTLALILSPRGLPHPTDSSRDFSKHLTVPQIFRDGVICPASYYCSGAFDNSTRYAPFLAASLPEVATAVYRVHVLLASIKNNSQEIA